jgi:hypothetical protein
VSRASRQEGPQAQDFGIRVLLDAVLGALCALGVMRADFSRKARQDRQADRG